MRFIFSNYQNLYWPKELYIVRSIEEMLAELATHDIY